MKFSKWDVIPLTLLFGFRILSVLKMIISDCDEVFNYWEPLNYLIRNFGKQTWEYSPEYSIRSWAYLLPYYSLLKPFSIISNQLELPQYYNFYFIRTILSSMNLIGEVNLFLTLKSKFDSLSFWFLLFSSISTGMTHGSIALLPSSFALSCNFFAISSIFEFYFSKNLKDSLLGIFWFSLAGLLGWPFSLVLAVPFIFFNVWVFIFKKDFLKFFKFLIGSAVISLGLLSLIVSIDSTLYQKLSIVPLNIVLYNVLFADEESGPNIFGTEPFSYYILNLLLNFNLIFILSALGCFGSSLLSFQNSKLNKKIKVNNEKYFSNDLSISLINLLIFPLIIWFTIFSLQPHKEERFLYPIYPLINLSAAIFIFEFDQVFKNLIFFFNYKKFWKFIYKTLNILLILSILIVSSLRTFQLINDYSAPLKIFKKIPNNATGNVCVGRQWYHYPSSFFLPNDNLRLKFVKSGFDGLLPGDFKESENWIETISSYPTGMNNKNLFDDGKVINFEDCSYYIDIDEQVDRELHEIELLKRFDNNVEELNTDWKIITCENFINNDKSKGIGRLLYIPSFLNEFLKTELVYHNYCLLENQFDKIV